MSLKKKAVAGKSGVYTIKGYSTPNKKVKTFSTISRTLSSPPRSSSSSSAKLAKR